MRFSWMRFRKLSFNQLIDYLNDQKEKQEFWNQTLISTPVFVLFNCRTLGKCED